MVQDKGLLEVIHRLVTDDDFRDRFLIAPRETLVTELGISRQAYDTLIALLPVLLAGGMFALGDAVVGGDPQPHGPGGVEWGGRRP
jgi:hypothetical protein